MTGNWIESKDPTKWLETEDTRGRPHFRVRRLSDSLDPISVPLERTRFRGGDGSWIRFHS